MQPLPVLASSLLHEQPESPLPAVNTAAMYLEAYQAQLGTDAGSQQLQPGAFQTESLQPEGLPDEAADEARPSKGSTILSNKGSQRSGGSSRVNTSGAALESTSDSEPADEM